ncbi:MAG: HAD hydrolase family protein [Acutalibacteraceae bacterium]|nr:HAD hydrolase family protein [Acutalibacteraceae bacterium]
MPPIPKIGMRLIKTAIAVFLCFLVDFFRDGGTPFYSAIAAILCMQPELDSSLKVGKERIIATVIGGIVGIAMLAFERYAVPIQPILVRYLVISIMVIILMYITVLLKKPSCAYLTCVVFMSIVISHVADANIYIFAFNRILDTLIGILIAIVINAIHIPHRKKQGLLFVCDLDHNLLSKNGDISQHSKIHLSRLLKEGACISFVTADTPASVLPHMEQMPFTMPLVILNGVALYDTKTHTYVSQHNLPLSTVQPIYELLKQHQMNCFIHVISKDNLHIYYGDFGHEKEKQYYEETRMQQQNAYIYAEHLYDIQSIPCYLKIMDTKENLLQLQKELKLLPQYQNLSSTILSYPSDESYGFLGIYCNQASIGKAALELKKKTFSSTLISFIGASDCASLLDVSDLSYVSDQADASLQSKATGIFSVSDKNGCVKKIEQLYWKPFFNLKK